jgi:hypothetical protein
MKVITTRLISSKKIKGTAIDPKFKEKTSNRQWQKVFQTDDQRPFDVYNLEQQAH